jgi:GMP synthase-like glutamine amidotransferase
MRAHVAVIDPGMRVPELDCFNRMARAAPIPLTYHLPALHGLDSLRRASDGVVGVVILGSGASVHDAHPWQGALDEWLLPRLEAGLPALGLCYGHQHLAHRLGGEVGFLFEDRHKLLGVRELRLDADPLWGGARAGRLVVSHREAVTRLPEALVAVGRSDEVAVDALRHRRLPIWGFQPHPEATTAFTANNAVPFDGDPEVMAFGHGLVDAFVAFAAREG